MIYFDNSATTRPYPEVAAVLQKVAGEIFGNPSSLHHLGGVAEQLLEQSRKIAASCLGVKAEEIIFTSGGTESNNTAIKGVAFKHKNRGKHLITSLIEHPAVYDVCEQLKSEFGYEITYLPVDRTGHVRVEDVKKAIRGDTILVSVMHVNNELGSIQPIAEIGSLLRNYPKIYFHVDAVQSFAKIPLKPAEWGVDLLSISAHKFHGPRGIGLLYRRSGIELSPLLTGGGQERGLRSGTENLPAIAAMAKAIKLQFETFSENARTLQRLHGRLWQGLNGMPGVHINSPQNGAFHIVNFSVPGVRAEVLLHALEEKGIYVSTKSACSSRADKPSRVLQAVGLDQEKGESAIRVSFSHMNTEDEVDQFLRVLKFAIEQLKVVGGV